jgi:hypothetical protein
MHASLTKIQNYKKYNNTKLKNSRTAWTSAFCGQASEAAALKGFQFTRSKPVIGGSAQLPASSSYNSTVSPSGVAVWPSGTYLKVWS